MEGKVQTLDVQRDCELSRVDVASNHNANYPILQNNYRNGHRTAQGLTVVMRAYTEKMRDRSRLDLQGPPSFPPFGPVDGTLSFIDYQYLT